MYAIKRITKTYDGSIGKHTENIKIVSCIKKKSDADAKMEELNKEAKDDVARFTQLEQEYVGIHRGNAAKFKEANPEGYDDFHKMRKSGIEGFVRHEMELVGKW